MFNEIIKLYEWVVANYGTTARLEKLWDGYAIRFPSGADIVQHSGSYRAKEGYVEPAGMPYSYKPISVELAQKIIEKNAYKLFDTP